MDTVTECRECVSMNRAVSISFGCIKCDGKLGGTRADRHRRPKENQTGQDKKNATGRICTCDFQIMSLASYCCSTVVHILSLPGTSLPKAGKATISRIDSNGKKNFLFRPAAQEKLLFPGIAFCVAMPYNTSMKLIRVFPRKTKATPVDPLAYFGPPDMFAEADEVHVSVTFTWDKSRAEQLAEAWRKVAPVKVGGVAYGDGGKEFVPGRYVRDGYIFTSRGCPRTCWFCSVRKRTPVPFTLPIVDGWNILDDNLLAMPDGHVRAVFAMLARQKRRIEFTGGLEAASLQDWHVGALASLKPRPTCFWAYDPGDPFETLENAAKRLLEAGFTAASHRLRCYVLIGYPKDTFDQAETRLRQMLGIGFTPMAMLWRPETASAQKFAPGPEWRAFQRRWARPAIIHAVKPLERKTRYSLPIC